MWNHWILVQLIFGSFYLLVSGFILSRTKAEPPIYYMTNKPMDEGAALAEQQKEQVGLVSVLKYHNLFLRNNSKLEIMNSILPDFRN